jgi:oligopeptide transport system ATP-binding protein
MKILDVNNLKTTFHIDAGIVQAVRGITFSVDKGESVGIVGESGSGKSVAMLSLMQLLPDNAKIDAKSINFNGTELTGKSDSFMKTIRGKEIGMIFQDPMTSLNPLFTVGDQITETIKIHNKVNKQQARQKALEMLSLVEIPNPESRLKQYPHEFSGGMRQRVMIAIAIACNPKLLIADEPTTALDVTIQAQILDLMRGLKNKLDTSIVMITHDLGVIVNMCSRILVMYGGTIVEQGTAEEIFYESKHPYTWGLLKSIPDIKDGKKNKLIPILGTPPDLLAPPPGCPFAPRCNYAMRVCETFPPQHVNLSEPHGVACHLMHPKAPKILRDGGLL